MNARHPSSPAALILAACLAAQPAVAQAQESADTSEQEEFKTVVTGKRIEEDPFLSSRSVSKVDDEDLKETAPRTAPEALWDSPGVFVQETSFGGGSPVLRGMIGPQVLLLVDGIRLSNSTYRTGPVQYLNLIDPLSIDSIEVLRGPGSFLYGSDAMGGVIQVFPLEPPDLAPRPGVGSGGDLLFRYASASRGKTGHGHFHLGAGGFGALGGVSIMSYENLEGGRGVGEQLYSGYDHFAGLATMMHRFKKGFVKGWSLKVGYLFSQIDDAGRTDKLYDSGSLQVYDNVDHLLYGKLHMLFPAIRTTADLSLSFQHFFERKDDHDMAEDLATILDTERDEVLAMTYGQDLAFLTSVLGDRLRLQYGGMWYRDWVEAGRGTRSPGGDWIASPVKSYPDGSMFDTYGLFLLVGGDPVSTRGGHVLRLEAGYRFHGMAAYAPAYGDLESVDFSQYGHVFTAGIQYIYKKLATAAFTFSQGFRAPNLQETVMLGDTGKFFHVPNHGLGPERADTFELLGRARTGPITFSWAGYLSMLHDLIKREETTWEGQTEINGKPVFQNVNGSSGLLLGTELQVAVALGLGFSLRGHLNYTWGEEEVEGGPDVPLTRIPPPFGTAAFRYESPWSRKLAGFGETYVRFAAKQHRLSPEDEKDARIPEGGTPGWWTWNIRCGLVILDHFRLGMTVENLLDYRYKYHASGVYSPGTNAVITAEMYY
jgi:hemoglobin/transferrin/lactoferrin receptor protein